MISLFCGYVKFQLYHKLYIYQSSKVNPYIHFALEHSRNIEGMMKKRLCNLLFGKIPRRSFWLSRKICNIFLWKNSHFYVTRIAMFPLILYYHFLKTAEMLHQVFFSSKLIKHSNKNRSYLVNKKYWILIVSYYLTNKNKTCKTMT